MYNPLITLPLLCALSTSVFSAAIPDIKYSIKAAQHSEKLHNRPASNVTSAFRGIEPPRNIDDPAIWREVDDGWIRIARAPKLSRRDSNSIQGEAPQSTTGDFAWVKTSNGHGRIWKKQPVNVSFSDLPFKHVYKGDPLPKNAHLAFTQDGDAIRELTIIDDSEFGKSENGTACDGLMVEEYVKSLHGNTTDWKDSAFQKCQALYLQEWMDQNPSLITEAQVGNMHVIKHDPYFDRPRPQPDINCDVPDPSDHAESRKWFKYTFNNKWFDYCITNAKERHRANSVNQKNVLTITETVYAPHSTDRAQLLKRENFKFKLGKPSDERRPLETVLTTSTKTVTSRPKVTMPETTPSLTRTFSRTFTKTVTKPAPRPSICTLAYIVPFDHFLKRLRDATSPEFQTWCPDGHLTNPFNHRLLPDSECFSGGADTDPARCAVNPNQPYGIDVKTKRMRHYPHGMHPNLRNALNARVFGGNLRPWDDIHLYGAEDEGILDRLPKDVRRMAWRLATAHSYGSKYSDAKDPIGKLEITKGIRAIQNVMNSEGASKDHAIDEAWKAVGGTKIKDDPVRFWLYFSAFRKVVNVQSKQNSHRKRSESTGSDSSTEPWQDKYPTHFSGEDWAQFTKHLEGMNWNDFFGNDTVKGPVEDSYSFTGWMDGNWDRVSSYNTYTLASIRRLFRSGNHDKSTLNSVFNTTAGLDSLEGSLSKLNVPFQGPKHPKPDDVPEHPKIPSEDVWKTHLESFLHHGIHSTENTSDLIMKYNKELVKRVGLALSETFVVPQIPDDTPAPSAIVQEVATGEQWAAEIADMIEYIRSTFTESKGSKGFPPFGGAPWRKMKPSKLKPPQNPEPIDDPDGKKPPKGDKDFHRDPTEPLNPWDADPAPPYPGHDTDAPSGSPDDDPPPPYQQEDPYPDAPHANDAPHNGPTGNDPALSDDPATIPNDPPPPYQDPAGEPNFGLDGAGDEPPGTGNGQTDGRGTGAKGKGPFSNEGETIEEATERIFGPTNDAGPSRNPFRGAKNHMGKGPFSNAGETIEEATERLFGPTNEAGPARDPVRGAKNYMGKGPFSNEGETIAEAVERLFGPVNANSDLESAVEQGARSISESEMSTGSWESVSEVVGETIADELTTVDRITAAAQQTVVQGTFEAFENAGLATSRGALANAETLSIASEVGGVEGVEGGLAGMEAAGVALGEVSEAKAAFEGIGLEASAASTAAEEGSFIRGGLFKALGSAGSRQLAYVTVILVGAMTIKPIVDMAIEIKRDKPELMKWKDKWMDMDGDGVLEHVESFWQWASLHNPRFESPDWKDGPFSLIARAITKHDEYAKLRYEDETYGLVTVAESSKSKIITIQEDPTLGAKFRNALLDRHATIKEKIDVVWNALMSLNRGNNRFTYHYRLRGEFTPGVRTELALQMHFEGHYNGDLVIWGDLENQGSPAMYLFNDLKSHNDGWYLQIIEEIENGFACKTDLHYPYYCFLKYLGKPIHNPDAHADESWDPSDKYLMLRDDPWIKARYLAVNYWRQIVTDYDYFRWGLSLIAANKEFCESTGCPEYVDVPKSQAVGAFMDIA